MTRLVMHTTENGRRRQRAVPPARDWPPRRAEQALAAALWLVGAALVAGIVALALAGAPA